MLAVWLLQGGSIRQFIVMQRMQAGGDDRVAEPVCEESIQPAFKLQAYSTIACIPLINSVLSSATCLPAQQRA